MLDRRCAQWPYRAVHSPTRCSRVARPGGRKVRRELVTINPPYALLEPVPGVPESIGPGAHLTFGVSVEVPKVAGQYGLPSADVAAL